MHLNFQRQIYICISLSQNKYKSISCHNIKWYYIVNYVAEKLVNSFIPKIGGERFGEFGFKYYVSKKASVGKKFSKFANISPCCTIAVYSKPCIWMKHDKIQSFWWSTPHFQLVICYHITYKVSGHVLIKHSIV